MNMRVLLTLFACVVFASSSTANDRSDEKEFKTMEKLKTWDTNIRDYLNELIDPDGIIFEEKPTKTLVQIKLKTIQ